MKKQTNLKQLPDLFRRRRHRLNFAKCQLLQFLQHMIQIRERKEISDQTRINTIKCKYPARTVKRRMVDSISEMKQRERSSLTRWRSRSSVGGQRQKRLPLKSSDVKMASAFRGMAEPMSCPNLAHPEKEMNTNQGHFHEHTNTYKTAITFGETTRKICLRKPSRSKHLPGTLQ